MITIDQLQNRIICADCLDILKQLPDKCVDLVLTDPPYGIGASKDKPWHKIEKKDWDDKAPSKEIFDEIFRISKKQIIWGGNYFDLPPTKGFFVWDKGQPENFSMAMCEFAWVSEQKPAKMFRYSVHNYRDRIHPTQKPVQLIEWCLLRCSSENDLVLDCFSGSGTTAVACHNLHRRFICIERDKEYCEASIKRLEQAQRQQTLF